MRDRAFLVFSISWFWVGSWLFVYYFRHGGYKMNTLAWFFLPPFVLNLLFAIILTIFISYQILKIGLFLIYRYTSKV